MNFDLDQIAEATAEIRAAEPTAVVSAAEDALGWLRRDTGKRFSGMDAATRYLRQRSVGARSRVVKNTDIELLPNERPQSRDQLNELRVAVDGAEMDFTHWSFGQLASRAKAPADYLRTLPGVLVRDNLMWSLQHNREVERLKVYHDGQTLRAINGPTYGRVDDFDVLNAVRSAINTERWKPAEQHMGITATDRTLNIFLVEEGVDIEIGKTRDGRPDIVRRGLRISNSEVGAAALKCSAFLFRSYCLNGMIFGLREDQTVKVDEEVTFDASGS
ncbi:MAG: hypothetical protein ACOCUN_02615, partial [Jiangellaceae bacterium]